MTNCSDIGVWRLILFGGRGGFIGIAVVGGGYCFIILPFLAEKFFGSCFRTLFVWSNNVERCKKTLTLLCQKTKKDPH